MINLHYFNTQLLDRGVETKQVDNVDEGYFYLGFVRRKLNKGTYRHFTDPELAHEAWTQSVIGRVAKHRENILTEEKKIAKLEALLRVPEKKIANPA